MQISPGLYCPLLKEECIQFKCAFWTHLRGLHPQTGQELDEYDCSIRWLPILLIENAKEVRQGAAAVESFRNKAVEAVSPLVSFAQLRHREAAQQIDDGEN